ncbi:MAG TPA: GDSL-type esterase/lipase family protein [Sphingobium sp.]|nr:GDSL-type esterase/lipase family protein [Sphingobium sp.]
MGAPLERLERSPVAKMVMAAVIFCLVVGGWMAWRHYREANATLPGEASRAGPCSLWFVGSSSIHRWSSLDRDMAPWMAVNRGIDDATFAQILPRFANAADGPGPTAIVLYAGENDIAHGASARTVVRDLARFLDLRSRTVGNVPVLILSMKPSPGRWPNRREQKLFNAAAERLLPQLPLAYFADITGPLLKDGKLGDNYRADGVHMNPAGYRIWAGVVRQRLGEILPAATRARCDPARRP